MASLVDAFDRLHPDLVDLLIRKDLLPSDEGTGFSEATLARSIYLAIELADPDEQALIVSRIISEEELAAERLQSPEVRNTNHRVVLDRAERKAALQDNTPATGEENGQDCLICGERAHVKVPCGCDYCLSCFRDAIRIGFRSSEEFPPKCCQPFTVETIALARSPALVHLFRQTEEEIQTPVPNRLYCHDGNCAAFIPHDRHGKCLLCDLHTCDDCALKAHPGQTCEEGDAEEDVWAAMDANRTVNCPNCGRMIQLLEACNHMTCVCSKQFCFICGKDYGTCHCPTYGEFHRMVPMKNRPGVKPAQFRRRVRRTEDTAAWNDDVVTLKIPQLRPFDGEEDRVPRVEQVTRERVIRPLRLPDQQEGRPRQGRDLERNRRHERERPHENWRRERRHEEDGRRRHRAPAAAPPQQVAEDLFGLADVDPFPLFHEARRQRPRGAPPAVGHGAIRQPIAPPPFQPVVRQPAVRQPAVRPPRVHPLAHPPIMTGQPALPRGRFPVIPQANPYGTQGHRLGFDNQRVGQTFTFADEFEVEYEDGYEYQQIFDPNLLPTMERAQEGQPVFFEEHHHHHQHGAQHRHRHHHRHH
ncbi:hypothetical protein NW762_004133 [Fusarium torreyae]|uniref:RING-type domain-containing protein n=1 Tax=Fusarium torreyae TaxID=1237075 RepID=A0A9W8S8E7_9HYPO|nr:hypothetical protein NW762_004133 [Fusarium torreyae]